MTKTVKFIRLLNFSISIVIPLVLLLIFGLTFDDFFLFNSSFGAVTRIVFFFYALPVTAVYAGIIFWDKFPSRIKDNAILFIPAVVMLFVSWLSSDLNQLTLITVMHATAYYIGLNICFVFGLFVLMSRSKERTVGRVLSVLFLIALAAIPVLYFFLLGKNIAMGGNGGTYILYLVEIFVVISTYYPKLVQLYIEKKL